MAVLAITASGCASSESSSSESQADSSSLAGAAEAPAQSVQNDDSRQIENLSDQIEKLSKRIDDLEQKLKNFSNNVHEIYDDTDVIEAYKKSDSSALTDEKDKFIYDQLTATVKEIIRDGMSDYDKEKAVYYYLFKNANYNYKNLNPVEDDTIEDYSHTPYGFFHDHSVICVGYATTFKLFMDALGIDCDIIHSTEQGEHAWNIVKIGGEWHHVDVFFDGGQSEPLYGAFNVSDSVKQQQHYPWNTGETPDFPKCNSLKYNPVVKEAKECKSVYDLPKQIAEIGKDGNAGVIYVKLPVPEGAGLYGFSQQVENILSNIILENKQLCNKCFADPETGFCYAAIGVEIPKDLDPDDDNRGDIPDDEDLRFADIDYDRLSEEVRTALGGEAEFNYDPDDYYDNGNY